MAIDEDSARENGLTFFEDLVTRTDFDGSSFIDLLQTFIILHMNKRTVSSPQTFRAYDATEKVQSGILFNFIGGSHNSPAVGVDANDGFTFDLSKRNAGRRQWTQNVNTGGGYANQFDFSNLASYLSDRLCGYPPYLSDPSTPDAALDPVVFLRDFADSTGWEWNLAGTAGTFRTPDPGAVDEFYDMVNAGEIVLPVRNMPQIIQNKGCYSETILYKIDKYALSPGTDVPSSIDKPVQTFYLSPRFPDPNLGTTTAPLEYIDSQVRYGVRYYYDIQQIRVVFGSSYWYEDLKLWYAGTAGYGRAIGNALGFYRATTTAIKSDSYAEEIDNYTPPGDEPQNDIGGSSTSWTPHTYNGFFAVSPGVGPSGIAPASPPMTLAEWQMTTSGSAWGDASMLDRVTLRAHKGWGFGGNPSGGMTTAAYNPPIPPVVDTGDDIVTTEGVITLDGGGPVIDEEDIDEDASALVDLSGEAVLLQTLAEEDAAEEAPGGLLNNLEPVTQQAGDRIVQNILAGGLNLPGGAAGALITIFGGAPPGGAGGSSGGWGGGMGGMGGPFSDRRLKENLTQTGVSPMGIPIYQFNYKGHPARYEGALAQDVQAIKPDAVGVDPSSGMHTLNYHLIDVSFRRLE
jgi:hypothetical protein